VSWKLATILKPIFAPLWLNLFNLFRDECGALYVATELLKKATSAATKEFPEGPAFLGDWQGMSDDEDDEEDGVGSGEQL